MTRRGCNRGCGATWYVLAIIIAIIVGVVIIVVVIIAIVHELRNCFTNHRWEFQQGLGLAMAKQLDVKYQLEFCNQLESATSKCGHVRSLCTCPCSFQQNLLLRCWRQHLLRK